MELDDTICYCFHVKKRKIVNFLRQNRLQVPSQLSECGGAGTGCGWCRPYLKKYFQQHKASETLADEVNADQYAKNREAYIARGDGTPPENRS